MVSESAIQKVSRLFLIRLGEKIPIFHWRIPVEQRRIGAIVIKNELRGFPDILISYRGRFVGAEAKRPGYDATPNQRAMGAKIRFSHGDYFVFHSLDELAANLLEIGMKHLEPRLAGQDKIHIETTLNELQNTKQISQIFDQSPTSGAASESDSVGELPLPFH